MGAMEDAEFFLKKIAETFYEKGSRLETVYCS